MPIRHAIWKIGEKLVPLAEISLGNESLLEKMIVEDPNIISERWMLIGRQVRASHGGLGDRFLRQPEYRLPSQDIKVGARRGKIETILVRQTKIHSLIVEENSTL